MERISFFQVNSNCPKVPHPLYYFPMAAGAAVLVPGISIVGGFDAEVLQLNRQALEELTAPKELKVIPGAGQLFEESGKLEQVADMASKWFAKYLNPEASNVGLIE